MSFNFIMTSTAFVNEGIIPQKYTCEGDDVSPSLNWEHTPVGTKSFVWGFSNATWKIYE